MNLSQRKLFVCSVFSTMALTCGCSASLKMAEVKPWERGTLAKPEMQLGANPGLDRALYKTFAAKEAGIGSGTAGGGGCGCN
jgi:hypothetical protein